MFNTLKFILWPGGGAVVSFHDIFFPKPAAPMTNNAIWEKQKLTPVPEPEKCLEHTMVGRCRAWSRTICFWSPHTSSKSSCITLTVSFHTSLLLDYHVRINLLVRRITPIRFVDIPQKRPVQIFYDDVSTHRLQIRQDSRPRKINLCTDHRA